MITAVNYARMDEFCSWKLDVNSEKVIISPLYLPYPEGTEPGASGPDCSDVD